MHNWLVIFADARPISSSLNIGYRFADHALARTHSHTQNANLCSGAPVRKSHSEQFQPDRDNSLATHIFVTCNDGETNRKKFTKLSANITTKEEKNNECKYMCLSTQPKIKQLDVFNCAGIR